MKSILSIICLITFISCNTVSPREKYMNAKAKYEQGEVKTAFAILKDVISSKNNQNESYYDITLLFLECLDALESKSSKLKAISENTYSLSPEQLLLAKVFLSATPDVLIPDKPSKENPIYRYFNPKYSGAWLLWHKKFAKSLIERASDPRTSSLYSLRYSSIMLLQLVRTREINHFFINLGDAKEYLDENYFEQIINNTPSGIYQVKSKQHIYGLGGQHFYDGSLEPGVELLEKYRLEPDAGNYIWSVGYDEHNSNNQPNLCDTDFVPIFLGKPSYKRHDTGKPIPHTSMATPALSYWTNLLYGDLCVLSKFQKNRYEDETISAPSPGQKLKLFYVSDLTIYDLVSLKHPIYIKFTTVISECDGDTDYEVEYDIRQDGSIISTNGFECGRDCRYPVLFPNWFSIRGPVQSSIHWVKKRIKGSLRVEYTNIHGEKTVRELTEVDLEDEPFCGMDGCSPDHPEVLVEYDKRLKIPNEELDKFRVASNRLLESLGLRTSIAPKSDNDGIYCLCYQEKYNGLYRPSTSCRQTREACNSLAQKIQTTGSKYLLKGSLSKSCTYLSTKLPWRSTNTSEGQWIKSKKGNNYWSPNGCHL